MRWGQLPVSGNDEFSELATVLNDLLIQQQRALGAAAPLHRRCQP
ncbi:MAG: hypothetical protein QM758_04185 [Armatimonas sp.]